MLSDSLLDRAKLFDADPQGASLNAQRFGADLRGADGGRQALEFSLSRNPWAASGCLTIVRKKPDGLACGLTAIIATAVIGGIGLLGTRLKPYWLAKYHGSGADLHGALLIYAPLAGANLAKANLTGANLHGARLMGAELEWANLAHADLTAAKLAGAVMGPLIDAHLEGADLTRVNLEETALVRTHLRGAILRRANMHEAVMQDTDLRETDLAGADLSAAALTRVDLHGARCDRRTRWPKGFDPMRAGAILSK